MSKLNDLTNKQFGEWTALKYLGNRMWLCRCSCGVEKEVSSHSLTSGASKSCGHGNKITSIKENDVFGKLTVLEFIGNGKWKCRCSCGEICCVAGKYLKSGAVTSCGKHKMEDLSGMTFGSWTALRYAGNLRWTCVCTCGKVKDVLTQALKPGRSTSCGCGGIDVKENYRNKMLAHFGDISATRINNPREAWKIDTTSDKSKLELCNFIKSIYSGKIETSNRMLIYPLELDIVLPEEKIAIEFNKDYWNSELQKTSNLYHSNKTDLCEKIGYRLISIFEYEWDKNKELIKRYIQDILTPSTVIYGRNTSVTIVSKDDAASFLNKYHLQGNAHSSIEIGLVYKDEIVGVMTFGRPRFNTNYQYELIRLAYKSGIRVIGGTEKLFEYFLRKYSPESIISYCDRSKFKGNTYEKLGMQFEKVSYPGYIWINGSGEVVSRYQSMKHKLIEAKLGDESQSGAEIMQGLGYYRIYDCGNSIFTWKQNGGGDTV